MKVDAQNISQSEWKVMSKMITSLFTHWKLSEQDQLAMLGLNENDQNVLTQFSESNPILANKELSERVEILLEIHNLLRQLFPNRIDLSYSWMSQPNKSFDEKTPVEIIKKDGMRGLMMVKDYLGNNM